MKISLLQIPLLIGSVMLGFALTAQWGHTEINALIGLVGFFISLVSFGLKVQLEK